MLKKKKLAEAEWEIMSQIWELNKPVSVRDIHSQLYPNGEKAYTTVQTIMNILHKKGFLRRDKVGLVNFYFPTISQTEFAKSETSTFVSRFFSGSFGALANFLINSGKLSEDELRELKEMIEAKQSKSEGNDD